MVSIHGITPALNPTACRYAFQGLQATMRSMPTHHDILICLTVTSSPRQGHPLLTQRQSSHRSLVRSLRGLLSFPSPFNNKCPCSPSRSLGSREWSLCVIHSGCRSFCRCGRRVCVVAATIWWCSPLLQECLLSLHRRLSVSMLPTCHKLCSQYGVRIACCILGCRLHCTYHTVWFTARTARDMCVSHTLVGWCYLPT